MDKQQIRDLLIQVKVFYPRFEAVEKDGNRYMVMTQTIDSWYRSVGWMEYDQALRILDSYMQSENGSKTPNAALLISGGKKQTSSGRCTASLDRRHGVIRWEPEHGEVFERKVVSETKSTIEDEEGYLWFWPEQEEE